VPFWLVLVCLVYLADLVYLIRFVQPNTRDRLNRRDRPDRRDRPFEAVERISHSLFQSIDLDELVETTLRIALEELGAEAGSILLADPEKEELIFQYSIGDKPS
jgi:hypothetical protein